MIAAAFFSGITMATFTASGFYFHKFWRASRDKFFLFFGAACWLMALERCISLFTAEAYQEVRTHLDGPATWIYVLRLIAFALILVAVIGKNRTTN